MSLIEKPTKINKTADINAYQNAYQKKYREAHLDHYRLLDKIKYMKRVHNLDDEFIKHFGECSGVVYKLQKEFQVIKERHPEMVDEITNFMRNWFDCLT